jgi:hypothetical protein
LGLIFFIYGCFFQGYWRIFFVTKTVRHSATELPSLDNLTSKSYDYTEVFILPAAVVEDSSYLSGLACPLADLLTFDSGAESILEYNSQFASSSRCSCSQER